MTITPENIVNHEIVGLHAVIQDSSDVTLCGVAGRIVSETKNTFYIRDSSHDTRTLQVAKKVAKKIQLVTDSGVCFISGSSLIGKPEDRAARLN